MPDTTLSSATGKRKTSIARVRLALGSGTIRVNGREFDEFFPRESLRILVRQPLEACNVSARYDVIASLNGGGVAGQAGALRHGIARALEKADPGLRPTLKRAGGAPQRDNPAPDVTGERGLAANAIEDCAADPQDGEGAERDTHGHVEARRRLGEAHVAKGDEVVEVDMPTTSAMEGLRNPAR